MDRAERKFDVMHPLGAEILLVCSNVQPASLTTMRVRPPAWGRPINQWRHAWRIVRVANHPALGLILDSFHPLAVSDDPSGPTDVPAEKIFLAQLADAPKLSMDVLSWSRHFRNFPGLSQLEVAAFVRDPLPAGYRGPLSLEVFIDRFHAAPARLMARDGLRSLLLVEAEGRCDQAA